MFIVFTAWNYPVTILELSAVITSLIGVWLGTNGTRVTWPWWVTSSILYGLLFLQYDLIASAALQLVFIAGGIWGWFGWGKNGAKPRLSTTKERLVLLLTLVILSVALYPILIEIGATSSAIESFGFVGSVMAQILMVLQRFEAWPLWLVVDIAYTYQYLTGKLYLTSFLYLIFTAVAVWGVFRWKREAKANGLPKFIK